MASHMQEQEAGDGTNFVLVFAGVLLELAEELLRMGLSVSEVSGIHMFLLNMCFSNIMLFISLLHIPFKTKFISNPKNWVITGDRRL